MKRFYLFLASVLMSLTSFAQWTEPAVPTAQPLTVGSECYLFNVDAKGFLVGANDWGTRASYSPTLGHKIILEEGSVSDSYYISNYVLDGWMANQWGYMFVDGLDAIWVDNTKDGKTENHFSFEALGDNVYKIGLSSENKTYGADYVAYYLCATSNVNDTRLYLYDPEAQECAYRWIFVSPADYESYIVARANYDASVELKAVLDEAKAYGVDCTAAQAVYDNTASSAADMQAAQSALEPLVRAAKMANASPDTPAEVLAGLGIATDFNDGNCPGWTSSTGAQNKQASNGNNAKDYSVTGNHYENWSGSAFSAGKIYATAADIPAGVYHLNALAFSNTGRDTYLYAGDSRVAVTTTNIDIDQPLDVYTVLAGSSLEVGLEVTAAGPNWVGLDNVYLYYLGSSAESYAFMTQQVLAGEPNYEDMQSEGTLKCQASVYEAYVAAKAAMQSATADTYAEAYTTFNAASAALKSSIAAYEAYTTLIDQANEWLQSTPVENEYIDKLGAYLNDDEAEGYNGNGTAVHILDVCTLNNEQIASETTYLNGLLYDAKSNSMADGDDCTSLLTNPNFAEQGGWQGAGTTTNITWPAGDTNVYPVMQASNLAFDLYQNLTGLQNGLYELDLQSAFRPGESYYQDYEQTMPYAYINSYETKIPNGKLEEETNGLMSAEEASAGFAEGKYPTVVYGVVTDGTMKVGLTNKVRTYENCIMWAGGLKLIFRAKNQEALQTVIEQTLPEATELKEAACGQPELDALDDAIDAAKNAESASDLYDGLIALKDAMQAVNDGVIVYRNLEIALTSLRDAIENDSTADAVTLETAKAYLETTLADFEARTLSSEEANAAIEQLSEYTAAIKMGKSIASEDNPVDYSSAIVNANFDPGKGDKSTKYIEGWTVSGALNGYKEYSCSFNKGTFDLHQDLVGLPKGKYKVTVHTYYRAGSFDEEAAAINAGKDTHLMKLYANTSDDNFETAVVNLSEGSTGVTLPEGISTSTINGITVPNGTSASVACYNADLFLNELVFTVGEDGKATIGLKLDETIGTNDYTVVGEWNLWYMGDPSAEKTEQDVSSLIVNANFDPGKGDKSTKYIEGWTVTGALNGYKEYSCSFNKGTFDLHQDLVGLPQGDYKVTVHTYYRAGSFDEEAAAINAGKDTHLMKLYANTAVDNYVVPVVNLSEGSTGVTLPEGISTSTINGITVPNGTSASVACYSAGLFLNELPFVVGEDGKATIGLCLNETIGTNDYTVVGEWNLYYYGSDATAVQNIEMAGEAVEMHPVAYYSLNGTRLSAPQRGINIVKMSNGLSVKMIVR